MSREQITFFRHALQAGLWLMKVDGNGRYQRISRISDRADNYQWKAWFDQVGGGVGYIDLFHTSPSQVLVFTAPTSAVGLRA